MKLGTPANQAIDALATYRGKQLKRAWASFDSSPYCFWEGIISHGSSAAEFGNKSQIQSAILIVSPRLSKSPLAQEVRFELPYDLVIALDHIYGQGCTFIMVAHRLGFHPNREMGNKWAWMKTSQIEDYIKKYLEGQMRRLSRTLLEMKSPSMSSGVICTLIKYGYLSRLYVHNLDHQHRDEIFATDLGL